MLSLKGKTGYFKVLGKSKRKSNFSNCLLLKKYAENLRGTV